MKKPATRPEDTKEVLTVRIAPALKRRMLEAADIGPYRLTSTNIIERGIELALKELSEMRLGKSK